ncbi:hypothetical protein COLO4_11823 [Corchorus olitorius]|uniref:Uncharacterized protein n=1 Tax=Corchorus olitorius TaxID=93759 RepID=A0A1R3K341_9ROSI|nr:hypothetical protein COLO4_11823 [Corchorus olitorius]
MRMGVSGKDQDGLRGESPVELARGDSMLTDELSFHSFTAHTCIALRLENLSF